jgi:hypothetical protein
MKRVIFLLVFMSAARMASAEVQSTAAPLAPPFLAACDAESALERLTALFNQGDWTVFQRDARVLLDALRLGTSQTPNQSPGPLAVCTPLRTVPSPALSALDYTTRHVALVWIGSDALGKTQLMRAVVHWPEPEPFSADLPGIGGGNGGLTEVVLAASLDARAVSLYTSTAEKNPLAEQLPGFVQAIFAPLSTTIAGVLGGVQGAVTKRAFTPAMVAPRLAVTVKGVVLPLRRASIRLQMRAKDLVSSREFTSAVVNLATTLMFDGAGRSDRARTQIGTLLKDLPETAAASCAAPGPADATDAASRAAACRDALDTVLKTAFDAAMTGTPSSGDAGVVANVDSRFRALAVTALSSSAELDMTWKNRPLTHFAFGAGSAVIAHGRLNRVRTKIGDGGTLVSDPLPRVMTMAFVNWSPRGYDEVAATLSARERIRGFFGAALTPDFGVIGGVNVLLQRGVGIVGGAGLLFGKGAEVDEIGKAPAAKEDPFKLALARTVFVGISYSYK